MYAFFYMEIEIHRFRLDMCIWRYAMCMNILESFGLLHAYDLDDFFHFIELVKGPVIWSRIKFCIYQMI